MIKSNTLLKNWGLSKFGPYRFTKVSELEYSSPVTMIYLPSLSVIVVLCLNGIPLRIRIAVPLALEGKLEWYSCPIHHLLSLLCESFLRCVSRKNIMSVLRDFKWASILPLFIGSFAPDIPTTKGDSFSPHSASYIILHSLLSISMCYLLNEMVHLK